MRRETLPNTFSSTSAYFRAEYELASHEMPANHAVYTSPIPSPHTPNARSPHPHSPRVRRAVSALQKSIRRSLWMTPATGLRVCRELPRLPVATAEGDLVRGHRHRRTRPAGHDPALHSTYEDQRKREGRQRVAADDARGHPAREGEEVEARQSRSDRPHRADPGRTAIRRTLRSISTPGRAELGRGMTHFFDRGRLCSPIPRRGELTAEGSIPDPYLERARRVLGVRPMKAVLYAAKSTADKHGSIPTQLADCLSDGRARGLGGRRRVPATRPLSAYQGNRGPGLERGDGARGADRAQRARRPALRSPRPRRRAPAPATWSRSCTWAREGRGDDPQRPGRPLRRRAAGVLMGR